MSSENSTILVLTIMLIVISVVGNSIIISMTKAPRITGGATQGKITLEIISMSQVTSYNIPLYVGQNWFSIPAIQDSTRIADVLSMLGSGNGTENEIWGSLGCTGDAADNFKGNYTMVWTYNASDNADPWKGYNPAKPCFDIENQKLQHIVDTQGYQITMNQSDILHVNGTKPQNRTINLEIGFNWIGYPTDTRKPIGDALMDLGYGLGTENEIWGSLGCTGDAADNFKGNYTMVWTYNASDNADPWKGYNPAKPCFDIQNQKLQTLVPGFGYQISVNNTESLTINW